MLCVGQDLHSLIRVLAALQRLRVACIVREPPSNSLPARPRHYRYIPQLNGPSLSVQNPHCASSSKSTMIATGRTTRLLKSILQVGFGTGCIHP